MDNVIPLSQRQLLWEQLMNATEWLDDLDRPLAADQRAHSDSDTASQRIRRAREQRQAVPFDRPPAA
jgi:hypothetical protein